MLKARRAIDAVVGESLKRDWPSDRGTHERLVGFVLRLADEAYQ